MGVLNRFTAADMRLREKFDEVKLKEETEPFLAGSRQWGIELPYLMSVRESWGITREELSSVLGRHRDYVRDIERGRRGILGLGRVVKIADVFGCDPADLTDLDSLNRYVSDENRKINNLRKKPSSEATRSVNSSEARVASREVLERDRLEEFIEGFTVSLGRNPSYVEIAKEFGVSVLEVMKAVGEYRIIFPKAPSHEEYQDMPLSRIGSKG